MKVLLLGTAAGATMLRESLERWLTPEARQLYGNRIDAFQERMREILMEALPDVAISLSSEIMPEIFEHERFSTTVANAVLAPVVGSYGKGLTERMAQGGYKEDVLLLHSGGGVMTANSVKDFAGRLAGSSR